MKEKRFETKAIRIQIPRSQNQEHSAPVYLTSSFVFDNAEELRAAFNEENDNYVYSRYANPNLNEFVEKMCALENAEGGVAMASGMAAVYSSIMALVQSGDHIIACSSLFGATHTIFTKYFPLLNISHTYFNVKKYHEIEKLVKPNTKIIYVESPTNPAIDILDIEFIAKIAKKHNIIFIVDNCFATPYIQQPINMGVDLVIHSATKFLDGQGRVLGGVVVGTKELIQKIYLFGRITGPALSSFNAWVLSKSIETLAVRMEKHSANALELAMYLEKHPMVEQVNYPFLPTYYAYELAKKQMKLGGGVVAFIIKGGYINCTRFLDALQMVTISPNLGDTRSIITHPASSTHSKLNPEEREEVGITDGLVRISVGLENIEDIIEDVNNGLKFI